jgi:mRNA interferase RelE/StbE
MEFMTGLSVDNPLRVGSTPARDGGNLVCPAGTYRVLYRIGEDSRDVTVVRIDHRRDVHH